MSQEAAVCKWCEEPIVLRGEYYVDSDNDSMCAFPSANFHQPVEPSPAVPQAQIPETHEAPPELLPRNDHDINVVGNWVGLSADEQVRFVECLRAVGFEIVASSQLSASIAREKALQTQLHVELIDRVARAEATIAELVEVVTIMRDAMNDKAHAWNHARKWLDEHDIYHGDLQENAVLAEVCKVLLARATGKES